MSTIYIYRHWKWFSAALFWQPKRPNRFSHSHIFTIRNGITCEIHDHHQPKKKRNKKTRQQNIQNIWNKMKCVFVHNKSSHHHCAILWFNRHDVSLWYDLSIVWNIPFVIRIVMRFILFTSHFLYTFRLVRRRTYMSWNKAASPFLLHIYDMCFEFSLMCASNNIPTFQIERERERRKNESDENEKLIKFKWFRMHVCVKNKQIWGFEQVITFCQNVSCS